ncbi:MAG: AAA domain-containing protein [Bacteroidia bacterium]|nr:AAA domain-containing protein [Bacteroidia bacterium]
MAIIDTDFTKIVQIWYHRKDKNDSFAANQIASIVFKKGDGYFTSRVIAVRNQYSRYFTQEGGTLRNPVLKMNWDKIAEDFPLLINPKNHKSKSWNSYIKAKESLASDSFAQMHQSIEHEIRDARSDQFRKAISAKITRDLAPGLGKTSFFYEATITVDKEVEFPIEEGSKVKLFWKGLEKLTLDALLLSYDSESNKIVFEVSKRIPSPFRNSPFSIREDSEHLLRALDKRLAYINKTDPELNSVLRKGKELSKKIFNRISSPEKINGNIEVPEDSLDESQKQAISEMLGRDITFLWGPPGTGKTHTLARFIACLACAGETVIAVAISNVAVDQLAIKTWQALQSIEEGRKLLSQGKILRYGKPRLMDILSKDELFPVQSEIKQKRQTLTTLMKSMRLYTPANPKYPELQSNILRLKDEIQNLTAKYLKKARILFCTAAQANMEPTLDSLSFHNVVADEASMMPVPTAISIASYAYRRVVFAGDYRQLGPIAISNTPEAQKWLQKDIFAFMGISNSAIHPLLSMITVQRRMAPEISTLINSTFYNGKLQDQPADLKPIKLGVNEDSISLFLQSSGDVFFSASASRINKESAEHVVNLVNHLIIDNPNISFSIGVITPYRAQVNLIRRIITSYRDINNKVNNGDIQVNTIHAYQGSEMDVIIWDLVDTYQKGPGLLYCDEVGDRLVNVAISRAKSRLIIIGDFQLFNHRKMSKNVFLIMKKHFTNENRIPATLFSP